MADMLVISCMDLRMVPLVTSSLKRMGYEGRYDLVSVAGASLSVGLTNRNHLATECQCHLAAWKETICCHVELSRKLHHSSEVWFIDHEDCGAYAAYYGPSELKEHQQHKAVLERVPAMFPDIKVRLFWMKLDGTLFELTGDESNWVEVRTVPNLGTLWVHAVTRRIVKVVYCEGDRVHYVYQDNGESSIESVDIFFSEWHDLNHILNRRSLSMV